MQACEEFVYDTSVFPRTLATDLDLVCGQDAQRRLLGSIMMAGLMLGSVLGGRLGDRLGRKRSMFLALTFIGPALLGASQARSLFVYAACQLTWCTAVVPIWINSHALTLECFDAHTRVPVVCIKDLFYPIELMTLGAVGYLLRDWTHLHLASGALCLLAMPTWWLLPESPRWLAQNGRREEAAKVLREMARVNGKPQLDERAEADIDKVLRRIEEHHGSDGDSSSSKNKLSFWHMFERAHAAKSAVLLLAWITTNVSSYTLQLNATKLAGNVHLNFIFAGLSEMPASVLLYFALTKTKRCCCCFIYPTSSMKL